MARARPKRGRQLTEIAEIILAEWYRVLPDDPDDDMKKMDASALTASLNQILEVPERHKGVAVAVLDTIDQPLRVVIPLPPERVKSKSQLNDYIDKNGDFRIGMGTAVLFGCGR